MVTQTLVATGLGVALLPELALEASRDPAVTAIGVRGLTPRRIALTGSAEMPPSPATSAVAAALHEATEARRARSLRGPSAGPA